MNCDSDSQLQRNGKTRDLSRCPLQRPRLHFLSRVEVPQAHLHFNFLPAVSGAEPSVPFFVHSSTLNVSTPRPPVLIRLSKFESCSI